MKKEYSLSWAKSTQIRKQRKFRAKAPSHIRRKFVSASLDKPLREKYNRRSFPLRVGDVVEVVRGSFKGKKGEVESIDFAKLKIYVKDCTALKVNGQKSKVKIDPSNVKITTLKLDDKLRVAALEKTNK